MWLIPLQPIKVKSSSLLLFCNIALTRYTPEPEPLNKYCIEISLRIEEKKLLDLYKIVLSNRNVLQIVQ